MVSPNRHTSSDLLTPQQVCARLNIGASTLAGWARNGLIEFVTLPGGHRRFPEHAVEAIERAEESV